MIIASLLVALYLNDPIAYEQLKIVNYAHLTATSQGIDPDKFLILLSCESKFNPSAKGDYRSETGEHMAIGVAQFWPNTFTSYSKKYGVKGTRANPYSSIDVATQIIAEEGADQWRNCNKIAKL